MFTFSRDVILSLVEAFLDLTTRILLRSSYIWFGNDARINCLNSRPEGYETIKPSS